MQSNFWSGSKNLDRLKKFGPAQNILGPVKGQGIKFINSYKKFVKVSDEFVIRKYFTPLCS